MVCGELFSVFIAYRECVKLCLKMFAKLWSYKSLILVLNGNMMQSRICNTFGTFQLCHGLLQRPVP